VQYMPRTIRDPRIQRVVLLGHPMSGTTGMISQIGREGKRLHHGRAAPFALPLRRTLVLAGSLAEVSDSPTLPTQFQLKSACRRPYRRNVAQCPTAADHPVGDWHIHRFSLSAPGEVRPSCQFGAGAMAKCIHCSCLDEQSGNTIECPEPHHRGLRRRYLGKL
jgi:hypothetical protein